MLSISVFSLLLTGICFSGSQVSWQRAEQFVKQSPCTYGGTIDSYLNKISKKKGVTDMEWRVFPDNDGFRVERWLSFDSGLITKYNWFVDLSGNVKPTNGKSMGLTPGWFK